MPVEELRAIIGMQFFDGKGQPLDHLLKGFAHRLVAASREHHPFTPASRHIDQLQGMSVFAQRALAAMMHQIDLEMPWFTRLPRNASHRHTFGHLIGSSWPRTGQAHFA